MGPFTNEQYLSQVRGIGSWYHDDAWFVSNASTIFSRSGARHDGINAGNFAFENVPGSSVNGRGFRLILTITGDAS